MQDSVPLQTLTRPYFSTDALRKPNDPDHKFYKLPFYEDGTGHEAIKAHKKKTREKREPEWLLVAVVVVAVLVCIAAFEMFGVLVVLYISSLP